jgi:hypothetical protein
MSLTSQDRLDPHRASDWFQNIFEQLRDQHNDLRTLLETSTVFKADEEKLQEVLMRVRKIVGPRIAQWIDEDVAASVEAGKLVRRDLFALDAEFNGSNENDEPSKSKRRDSEGHDESPVLEKPSSPLKRAREEVEDNADGSEDEVEHSISMRRSLSSSLEDPGPVSKKARLQGKHVHDTANIPSGSLRINSDTDRPQPRFTPENHAGPSTSSHTGATSRLFPPSAFPRVRPPPAPKRPYERSAKPLQRDTMRLRENLDTGEPEIFDYELTPEYRERLQREQYCIHLQPTVFDSKLDFQTMTELDEPRFKFNREAWQNFEDHTLIC